MIKEKEYNGYTVYSDGRIKSNRSRKVFLKPYDCGKGYASVKINEKTMYLHKVITECFLGKRPNRYTVNHKDGNKLNNNLSNLEYISFKDNYQHALINGLKRNILSVISNDEISDLIECYYNSNYSQKEIAESIGFDKIIFKKLLKDMVFDKKGNKK